MKFLDFNYYPDDPVEKMPVPVGIIFLSFIGVNLLFAAYAFFWSVILTAR